MQQERGKEPKGKKRKKRGTKKRGDKKIKRGGNEKKRKKKGKQQMPATSIAAEVGDKMTSCLLSQ